MKTLETIFDQYVGKTVQVLDTCPKEKMRGKQGVVTGVDPRPFGHADGEWLVVKYSEGTIITPSPSKEASVVEQYAHEYLLPSHVKIV